ncbi:flagellar hook-associated protein FlgL [Rhodanobacter sp. Col0626]|uniref:flagellar hook-associated protein FlgL n=1 Tax=Rhodanobacter sp. Col0626 TaxID=3415679 RepID=UPI003CFB5192
MRLSTSWMYQQSLSTMLNQQSALAATQNQVSTGKRINVASDDPVGAGKVISLDHILAANAQYSSNIDSANTRLSTEQTALTGVTNLLDSARSMALQGINGTLSSSDRKDMATQLSQLRDQLIQLANTSDSNGDALFAGTSTTKTPFVQGANGAVSYAGNDAQLMAAIGSGLQIYTGDAGSGLFMGIPSGNGSFTASAGGSNTGTLVVGANAVSDPVAWGSASAASGGGYTISFDGAGNWSAADANGDPVVDGAGNPVGGAYQDGGSISFNGMSITLTGAPATGDTVAVKPAGSQDIFSTLGNMIAVLQGNGSDTDLDNGLNRQIESLDQGLASASNAMVAIGGRMNTLDQQKNAYADLGVTYESSLSDTQNVDVYTAISNLSLQSAALQASQQVFAQVKSMSLFNYIK